MAPKIAGRDVLQPELLTDTGPRALMHATERLLARSYGFLYDAVVSGWLAVSDDEEPALELLQRPLVDE